jgi:hypothetical protein
VERGTLFKSNSNTIGTKIYPCSRYGNDVPETRNVAPYHVPSDCAVCAMAWGISDNTEVPPLAHTWAQELGSHRKWPDMMYLRIIMARFQIDEVYW